MIKFSKLSLFLLRIAMGWFFFYSGITKILNPEWSAAGFLTHANTFPELFAWFASPGILPFVNFANEWGLTLLGISLILGVFVRLSSLFGAILMILYYLPVLTFPYIGEQAYIVDEHIIYALVLLFFVGIKAGRVWGLDSRLVSGSLGRYFS